MGCEWRRIRLMSTGYEFVANHVFSDNDGEMCIVGFADDESNPSKFVIIQKLLAPTESERAMRLGGVHLQVEDESRSAYDAIESVQVEADRVKISLRQEVRAILKIDRDISIDCSHPAFEKSISELKKMCELDGIAFSG